MGPDRNASPKGMWDTWHWITSCFISQVWYDEQMKGSRSQSCCSFCLMVPCLKGIYRRLERVKLDDGWASRGLKCHNRRLTERRSTGIWHEQKTTNNCQWEHLLSAAPRRKAYLFCLGIKQSFNTLLSSKRSLAFVGLQQLYKHDGVTSKYWSVYITTQSFCPRLLLR